jgi:phosphopantothenoylcysteine decarboxylase/phosphopantothenate--cysteine ligase
VVLVTTSAEAVPHGVTAVHVEQAEEMAVAVLERADDSDIVVMAAAVADFRPEHVAPSKLKKAAGVPEVRLVPTTDVLAEVGARRRPGQVVVGFAAETADVAANAAEKLTRKGADLIVANDVAAAGVGFEHDTNEVLILSASGDRREVPLTGKRQVAAAVFDAVVAVRQRRADVEASTDIRSTT